MRVARCLREIVLKQARSRPRMAPAVQATPISIHGEIRKGSAVTDWRDPEAYAYTDSLHVHEWAWEFLRRNTEYQSSWRDYDQRCKERETATGTWHETLKWGIHEPADPGVPAPEGVPKWTEWVDSVLDEIEDYEELYGDGAPDSKESFTFDLLKPIDPQLEVARIYLRSSQKCMIQKVLEAPRIKRDHFKTYLRLLDAAENDASKREMGRVLFSDRADERRSAQTMLKTAQSMASDQYRELLLLAE